ncbi:Uncharacterised protein [Mycobacterium tuberculosis]|nr:Uncharacterised protein [Mycobacterium tuberculosis]
MFQYASITELAKKHDVPADPRPACVPYPVPLATWKPWSHTVWLML